MLSESSSLAVRTPSNSHDDSSGTVPRLVEDTDICDFVGVVWCPYTVYWEHRRKPRRKRPISGALVDREVSYRAANVPSVLDLGRPRAKVEKGALLIPCFAITAKRRALG